MAKKKPIISIMKRPANWKAIPEDKQTDEPPAKPKTRTKRTTGTIHGKSKKEQALDLYGQFVSKSGGIHPGRQDMIQTFVEHLGMTPAGASTYVAMCKKAHS